MNEIWHKTACVLCEQNCGLKVHVQNNRIETVLPDESHPVSKGYVCRKGLHIGDHQNHADRLTQPLKKTANGFIQVSWETALQEIASKLKQIISDHSPQSFAFMGGMNKGCHIDAIYARTLLKMIGSPYHYHAIAQEHTGMHWLSGQMLGRQDSVPIPDDHHADMILAVGWDGMESHKMIRSPMVLKTFATHPHRRLVVIDHRNTSTAQLANVHLLLNTGTYALLAKTLIAIILQEGWENKDYIQAHVTGLDDIRHWFHKWDIKYSLEVCGIELDTAYALCHELGTRKWCLKLEKGALMNRHSTVTSYFFTVLLAICGRLCTIGGNVITGKLFSLTDTKTEPLKTVFTRHPSICGFFPPNVLPQEIDNNHSERIRALLVCGANPIRSYADTHAYTKAFEKLELLTVIDIAMTETCEMADYVLPACSAYESWDTTFYSYTFPDIFTQLRPPIVQPSENLKECGTIITELADQIGLIPKIPDHLQWASTKDRYQFILNLLTVSTNAFQFDEALPFILSKTLGKTMNSSNLAVYWGIIQTLNATVRKRMHIEMKSPMSSALSLNKIFAVAKTMISRLNLLPLAGLFPRFEQSEAIFDAIIDNPEGLIVGQMNPDNNMQEIKTIDEYIHLHIPVLADWSKSITPELEQIRLKRTPEFPMILNAGRPAKTNAHCQIRKPDWNKGLRSCTVLMHPKDANRLGFDDGQIVCVITKVASVEIELEVSEEVQEGQLLMPHGGGLKYQKKTYGVNVNDLTDCQNRDVLTGIPLHQYMPCRVEALFTKSDLSDWSD
ncbi:MAG: molybdopterin dinucleotide-binding protein [Candidatus Magnetoglobus multicellularis str. Araruama]|uniref:Molybdopterin dinucleotide-binding protein n=1 Tax=Candidatus Magnetoglobus multicellularis str. Araruama TaxID=890399 RepID=A0A1V1PHI6_9BACT|nr:MAG: molybdopterin dinucleotide-binding protein [Candidatus Magnetoglobus multicellularis str. Araruama]